MSETSTADTDGFDPGRLRTAPTQMLRSRDDRYIAGVCGGLARYLNIDPVIVRVLMAALTVVGGVGLVVYAAAWLLAPEEGAEQSVLESHVPGNPRIRVIGWIVAGVIAVAAVVGSGPWFDWGWVGPFPLLALAVLGWILFRQRPSGPATDDTAAASAVVAETVADQATATTTTAPTSEPDTASDTASDAESDIGADEPAGGDSETHAREDRPTDHASSTTTTPLAPSPPTPTLTTGTPHGVRDNGVLTWLTLAAAVVVIGVLWLVDQSGTDIDGPVYLASSLGVVAAGMLAGTWWGNGRWLIPVGALISITLIGVSQLPVWKFGQVNETPTRAADVLSSYEMGAGQIDLDLTQVQDLAALDGRTITFDNGMGQTHVELPENLDVTVVAELNAGDVQVLGREANGADASTQYTDPDDADPDLRLEIDGSLGNVEVIRP